MTEKIIGMFVFYIQIGEGSRVQLLGVLLDLSDRRQPQAKDINKPAIRTACG